jgi:hypothetical protein
VCFQLETSEIIQVRLVLSDRSLILMKCRNRLANEERKLAPASEGTVDNDAPLSILAT